ncbi:nucleoside 2-deoxyribosyltransferase [Leuconostoc suionicum]|uniref:nucleoside 2-deoxyribosyltransferase n=1 Tax=Leuconostoc suionicum TaxID=1511761 RepID=UPI00233E8B8C|nr:nucleoside 2-deoxyribosyltransferase [Leuconostoc suionicum]MDC2805888.1 nucleoside 2-deoxyribosyltransferase [Leuconostoc suionicum]MDC2823400.1 nucleoside 2-deoxyribosyltransferase [Leuconostoc suionicum]
MSQNNNTKFYIAGSFRYSKLINNLSDILESLSFVRTYDWTVNEKADSIEKLHEIANEELQGVEQADFLVFIFPSGKGANIELGIATALKKRIYILDIENEIENFDLTSTFYFLDNVKTFKGGLDDFAKFIVDCETS